MQSGTLTEQIEIFRKTEIRNEYGEKVYVYEPIQKIRCNVVHQTGSRYVQNDEIWHGYTKTFKVRLHTDIQDEDKILYNNKFYIVESIDIDTHQQTITIIGSLINEQIDS